MQITIDKIKEFIYLCSDAVELRKIQENFFKKHPEEYQLAIQQINSELNHTQLK